MSSSGEFGNPLRKFKLVFLGEQSALHIGLVLVIATLTVPGLGGISTDDQAKIETGLEVGKAVAELLENKQFTKSLTKIATSIGPYLGALGPFVGLVMAFMPIEDPIMNKLKTMMKNIDNRFDKMDSRFDDLERKIDWSVVQINFGQIEQNIMTMVQRYKILYSVPKAAVEVAGKNFIMNYRSVFDGASNKLYTAIVQKGVFQKKTLATSVMQKTKYNRRETQAFLLGVMKLLLQSIKLELSYYAVQKETNFANHVKKTWEKNIQKVRTTFEQADRVCRDRYHAQLSSDINDFAVKNKGMSNKKFVAGLWREIAAKYYWRHWIVVAYNEIWGGDNHWVQVCGGYIRFRNNGRNFLVASKPSNSRVMNLKAAASSMKRVSMKKRKGNRFVRRQAKEVFKSLNRSGACSVGVIKCGQNLWYYYHTKRFKYVNRCPHFNLHMWG